MGFCVGQLHGIEHSTDAGNHSRCRIRPEGARVYLGPLNLTLWAFGMVGREECEFTFPIQAGCMWQWSLAECEMLRSSL